jgi:hypothetical protein
MANDLQPRAAADGAGNRDLENMPLGKLLGGLNAKQLYGLIGVALTVLGGTFTLGMKSKELFGAAQVAVQKPIQKWLVIHGVDGAAGEFVRVTARVNSIPYAYPADVTYTQIGAGMAEQRQPLPLADLYTLSFEAELRETSANPRRLARSRDTAEFQTPMLPAATQTYRVNILNPAGMKLDDQFLTIKYSFR